MRKSGELHHLAKFSDAQVERVREMCDEGVPIAAIRESMNPPISLTHLYALIEYRLRTGSPSAP